MKILKGLFILAVALVAALLVLGFFLPDRSHIERSIDTTASAETVYEVISSFRRFNEWSPWAGLDPDTKYTYAGPESGVGARMAWSSEREEVGSGSQEIIAVEPGRSVTIQLDFGSHGKPVTRMDLRPAAGGTHIVWSMDSDFSDDFAGRYFGPLLDRMVGPDYEKGLARLKRLVEVTPPADAPLTSPSREVDASPADAPAP